MAALKNMGAAGREAAAGRQIIKPGRIARNRSQTSILSGVRKIRKSLQEPLGVGMLRVIKDSIDLGVFSYDPTVHDQDSITNLGHNPQVMGYKQNGQPQLLP